MPFASVPPVLAELGHARRPMLEIICLDADRGILASVDRLAGLGFGASGRA